MTPVSSKSSVNETQPAHLKSDMVIPYANFELLLAHDVFLGPVGVVFSADEKVSFAAASPMQKGGD